MLQDLRYGIRRMLQARAWAALVVLSCAIGIGANTALFSLIEAVLLRKLPIDQAEQLVYLNWLSRDGGMFVNLSGNSDVDKATGLRQSTSFSTLTFERIRASTRTLSAVFAFAPLAGANLQIDNYASIADGQFVSGNYFNALHLKGMRGRPIVEADDHASAARVIVISDRLWQRRFQRDPAAVGRTLAVNGTQFTIVGVTPPEFTGTHGFGFAADFSIPLALEAQLLADDEHLQPWSWWLRIMARVAPDEARAQVQAELEPIFVSAAAEGWRAAPPSQKAAKPSTPTLQVLDGSRGLADQVRNLSQFIISFAAIVGILLLIVCVNVANLVLARSVGRQREIGVRLAIGASRARLVRLLLAESLVLCTVAGTVGVLLAAWGIDLVALYVSRTSGMPIHLRLDLRVLGFATLVSLLTGAAFGLGPALRATRLDLADSIKSGAASLMGRSSRVTRPLVVVQLGLSLALLVVTGLLARSVWRLQAVDVGFKTEDLLLFNLNPEAVHYTAERSASLYEEIVRRVEVLPGVQAASVADYPLVSGAGSGTSINAERSDLRPDLPVRRLKIRPNFMRTMGVSITQGRDFQSTDDQRAPRAALINQTLARTMFPQGDAVGQRFGFGSTEHNREIEIVGVVKDASIDEVRTPTPPTVYLPYLQRIPGSATFVVRATGARTGLVPAIEELVRRVAPELPVTNFRTQRQQVESGFAAEKLLARVSLFFAAIALLLACLGLYGMIAYNVTRRTGEIAVRMAFGAGRSFVVWLVLREVVLLLAIGIAIGVAAALALTRTIEDMLFGLGRNDPLTLIVAALVLSAVGVSAAYFPARRAARINPWDALRYE